MTEVRRDGSRTVALLMPFTHLGQNVEQVTFKPVVLDVTLRWQEGAIGGVLALMSELTGLPEHMLGQLRYPDADLVMDHFMAHLPKPISSSIANGEIPVPLAPIEPEATEAFPPMPRMGPQQPADQQANQQADQQAKPSGNGDGRRPWVGIAPPDPDALYDPDSPTAKEGDRAIAEFRRRQLETLGPEAEIVSGYGGFEGLGPDGS